MAILDGLKNAVAANVARSANNVAVNGLRSIAGNVFGVDLNPTNPAAKLEKRTTRFTLKTYQKAWLLVSFRRSVPPNNF